MLPQVYFARALLIPDAAPPADGASGVWAECVTVMRDHGGHS